MASSKTRRLPGVRNVVRLTRKLARVGTNGLKKVGRGVTGFVGKVLKNGRNVFRGMTKRRKH